MATATRPKVRREDLHPGESLCDHCTAKCCKYFALAIDTPATREDFDLIRWYVLHEDATVFTEDETWYLLVYATCRHLLPDNRCGIYHTRPQICRDYSTANCEYDEDTVYDRYFETAEQVEEYMEAVLPPEKGQDIRSPRPPMLPILS